MKTINLVLFLVFARGLMACAQVGPLPPDQISANLGPILKIEDKARQVFFYSQVLSSVGCMTERSAKTLKAHFDVFHVYYLAATIHLAEGKTKSYLAAIKSAERELHIVEAILKDKLREMEGSNSGQRRGPPDEACKSHGHRPEDTF